MIRQVESRSTISRSLAIPNFIANATDDDTVIGAVILDLVDRDFSWVALTQNDQGPGYTAIDMAHSRPTVDEATATLHDVIRSVVASNRGLVPMPTRRAAPPPVFEPEYEPEYEPVAAPRRRASRWTDNLAAKIRNTPPWGDVHVAGSHCDRLCLCRQADPVHCWLRAVHTRGVWLSMRFPLTMLFANSFIAALLGGGRQCRPGTRRQEPRTSGGHLARDAAVGRGVTGSAQIISRR